MSTPHKNADQEPWAAAHPSDWVHLWDMRSLDRSLGRRSLSGWQSRLWPGEILAAADRIGEGSINIFEIWTYVNLRYVMSGWHVICTFADKECTVMVSNLSKLEEVNVLASHANWAWPEALRCIFQPRGVNLLVAGSAAEFVSIIERKRIHTTIIDMDSQESDGLATIRIIRMDYPLLPCILLASTAGKSLLGKALRLDVFSVIDKPVDMQILREQLNRLFLKKYHSTIFQ